jgi:hypothetical protein
VLAAVSGNDASANPQAWWDWWRTESDTQLSGNKETVTISEEQSSGGRFPHLFRGPDGPFESGHADPAGNRLSRPRPVARERRREEMSAAESICIPIVAGKEIAVHVG